MSYDFYDMMYGEMPEIMDWQQDESFDFTQEQFGCFPVCWPNRRPPCWPNACWPRKRPPCWPNACWPRKRPPCWPNTCWPRRR